ncbi:Uncharacterised protein [Legionella spiritensis]|nr:Uncharacterised protein [Legionella spiritensis]VEG90775.1 Uncharacterised protein [Legionella spiritensis]
MDVLYPDFPAYRKSRVYTITAAQCLKRKPFQTLGLSIQEPTLPQAMRAPPPPNGGLSL